MSIEVTENLVGIWFVPLPDGDWQGGLTELEPNKRYEIKYRFRHTRSRGVWKNDDVKRWGGGEFMAAPGQPISREKMTMMIEATAEMIAAVCGSEVHRVMMPPSRDPKVFMGLMSAQPWCHIKLFDDPEECVNFLRANGFGKEADELVERMRKGAS